MKLITALSDEELNAEFENAIVVEEDGHKAVCLYRETVRRLDARTGRPMVNREELVPVHRVPTASRALAAPYGVPKFLTLGQMRGQAHKNTIKYLKEDN